METAFLQAGGTADGTQQSLILLHPNSNQEPRGTHAWLTPRQVSGHYHIRWDREADVARLARFLAGRAVGLVLSGGGTRGFAHIGVIRALAEAHVPIDFIGGTSMGSFIAAQYAMGWDYDLMLQRNMALSRSVFDFTLPLVALLRGRRLARKLQLAFGERHIEDLWLPYFCVSSSLTRAEAVVHRLGPVWRSLRASAGLPGILPPLAYDGDWLVDGALLNNLPIDIMSNLCDGGIVIAVDVGVSMDMAESVPYGESLSGWQVVWNKVNPFATKLNVPNIATVLLPQVNSIACMTIVICYNV